MGLKTTKESQKAAIDFLYSFDNQEIEQLNGHFIPANPIVLHRHVQRYLCASIGIGLITAFLIYQAAAIDAIHYWHVDFNVLVGIVVLMGFGVLFVWCFRQYWSYNRLLQETLMDPQQHIYGTLVTDEYFFERTPTQYHIIPRANIVRIDYEEERAKGEYYLELLLEWDEGYEVRGIIYDPANYDLRTWVKNCPAAVPL